VIESASVFGSVFAFIIGAARFIVLLGILVFVHELGHFFAAKLSNVYVVRLSLGWGKRLFGFKRGDTDYCLSMFPIGGYVKMVGQEDMPRTEEEAAAAEPDLPDVPPERRYNNQPAFNRFAISFAGPFMNLLFALPVFWLVFMIGIHVPISTRYTRIGTVQEGSPADKAGIKPGQRVVSIDGATTTTWEEVWIKIMTSEGRSLSLELEDLSGGITHVNATPTREEDAPRASLGIEGLAAFAVSMIVPDMPAERGGLEVGDIILAYDDNPPDNESMTKLVDVINQSAGRPMAFTVLRDGSIVNLTLVPEEVNVIDGIVFDGNTVVFVEKESVPGENLELQIDDVVTAVNGRALDEAEFRNFLAAGLDDYEGADLTITVERSQGMFSEPRTMEAAVTVSREGRVGTAFSPFVMEKFGPGQAALRSVGAFVDSVGLTFKTFYYLLSLKLSPKELAGPIGIAVMTEKSLAVGGIGYYLNLVAFITINLAIINLLPIPLLDGGMILLTVVEAIRRKPLEEKHMLIFQKVGVVFIVMIFVLAMYNDALRAFRFFLGGEFLE